MASTYYMLITMFAIVNITLLHFPLMASGDFLAPLLAPVISNFCHDVGCGRGKCKVSENTDFQYECECDPGWKQSLSSNTSAFKFLPCIIPNCTLDSSCSSGASSPAPSREIPLNASMLEPCNWANCGGGECNKTSAFTYSCLCKEGYYNLFNNTGFPCFQNCSIGGDCPDLGIVMTNKSTSTPAPNLPDTGSNNGCTLQHEVFLWMIVFLISIGLAL